MRWAPKGYGGARRDPEQVKRDGWHEQHMLAVCGPRAETEFAYSGPDTGARPDDPAAMTDAAWVDWLTVPPNPAGPVDEIWWHQRGCGLWLRLRRDTCSHDIIGRPEVLS